MTGSPQANSSNDGGPIAAAPQRQVQVKVRARTEIGTRIARATLSTALSQDHLYDPGSTAGSKDRRISGDGPTVRSRACKSCGTFSGRRRLGEEIFVAIPVTNFTTRRFGPPGNGAG
jgi:hypothetical protein